MIDHATVVLDSGELSTSAGDAAAVVRKPDRTDQFAAARVSRIGHYRLLRVIGSGGMGVVYLAEQDNPRRPVAIKLIHSSTADAETLARFELEGHVLGRLRHPGIAQIYEAGRRETGGSMLPYLVMEYVDGESLINYATRHGLCIRARMRLLAAICDAIEHAHQRGVIHRDLKPGNVLVGAEGQIKILDFGVARITDPTHPMDSHLTTAGFMVGTLSYMSPEQTRGDSECIDTRSDVYALGVLGFELLSGRLPYEPRSRDPYELVRAIRESPPIALASVAPAARGDVEIIIGKALAKDPEQRYAGAGALAEDIRRYLANDPIRARPPSLRYQAFKLAQRNRALTFAALTAVIAIVGGLVGVSVAALRASEARRLAEGQAARAEATLDFIQRTLVKANPQYAQGRVVTVREALDSAASELDAQPPSEPLVELEIRRVLGVTYSDLGQLDAALKQYELGDTLAAHVLAPDAAERIAFQLGRGVGLLDAGRLIEAERVLRMAAAAAQRHPADSIARVDADTALVRCLRELDQWTEALVLSAGLEARAEPLFGQRPDLLLDALTVRAALIAESQSPRDALPLRERAYHLSLQRFGPTAPRTLIMADNFAGALSAVGRASEAHVLLTHVAEASTRVLGTGHPDSLTAQNNLALHLKAQGDLAGAEHLLRGALAEAASLPPGHIIQLRLRQNLSALLYVRGRLDEATEMGRAATEVAIQAFGDTHSESLMAMMSYAVALNAAGRPAEAGPWYERALGGLTRAFGPKHRRTLIAAAEFAAFLRDQGDLDQSARRFEELLPQIQSVFGSDSQQALIATYQYAGTLQRQQRFEEALAITHDLESRARAVFGASEVIPLLAPMRHARTLIGLGRFAEAAKELERAWANVQRAAGASVQWKRYIADAGAELAERNGDRATTARWQARGATVK